MQFVDDDLQRTLSEWRDAGDVKQRSEADNIHFEGRVYQIALTRTHVPNPACLLT